MFPPLSVLLALCSLVLAGVCAQDLLTAAPTSFFPGAGDAFTATASSTAARTINKTLTRDDFVPTGHAENSSEMHIYTGKGTATSPLPFIDVAAAVLTVDVSFPLFCLPKVEVTASSKRHSGDVDTIKTDISLDGSSVANGNYSLWTTEKSPPTSPLFDQMIRSLTGVQAAAPREPFDISVAFTMPEYCVDLMFANNTALAATWTVVTGTGAPHFEVGSTNALKADFVLPETSPFDSYTFDVSGVDISSRFYQRQISQFVVPKSKDQGDALSIDFKDCNKNAPGASGLRQVDVYAVPDSSDSSAYILYITGKQSSGGDFSLTAETSRGIIVRVTGDVVCSVSVKGNAKSAKAKAWYKTGTFFVVISLPIALILVVAVAKILTPAAAPEPTDYGRI